ncbi:cytochrome c1 [Thiohalophilus sp.]|uniref:cytochrome c1 n=1 Tax=Thiohalophilus sp. TaxID=3028392 RepID=UPI0029500250|nr:cytochrome c1 [Thiohalophilus sp.]
MKKLTAFLLMMAPVVSMAAGGGVKLLDADVDLNNKASLQRGAQLYVNYCMGCHSLSYMRYNRMGKDLGLSDEQVVQNLMPVADFSKQPQGETPKSGSLMKNAMPGEAAEGWFGTKVPDLSVVARSRGPDWLYTYLKTFYVDESRPMGVNNQAFPLVGMPHVLWELEGLKKPVYETHENADGEEVKELVDYEFVKEGSMSPAEYDDAMRDLVNFLVYVGEPAKLDRYKIGVWVILFLVILFFFAYALKKEYWRDVH